MKRTIFVAREIVSGVLYPYNSKNLMLKNRTYSQKINVYSYRRTHRCASCGAGVLCVGVVG
jgi:hypothetical protein